MKITNNLISSSKERVVFEKDGWSIISVSGLSATGLSNSGYQFVSPKGEITPFYLPKALSNQRSALKRNTLKMTDLEKLQK